MLTLDTLIDLIQLLNQLFSCRHWCIALPLIHFMYHLLHPFDLSLLVVESVRGDFFLLLDWLNQATQLLNLVCQVSNIAFVWVDLQLCHLHSNLLSNHAAQKRRSQRSLLYHWWLWLLLIWLCLRLGKWLNNVGCRLKAADVVGGLFGGAVCLSARECLLNLCVDVSQSNLSILSVTLHSFIELYHLCE